MEQYVYINSICASSKLKYFFIYAVQLSRFSTRASVIAIDKILKFDIRLVTQRLHINIVHEKRSRLRVNEKAE